MLDMEADWQLENGPRNDPRKRAAEDDTSYDAVAKRAVASVDEENHMRVTIDPDEQLPLTQQLSPGASVEWNSLVAKATKSWAPAILTERQGHKPHSLRSFEAAYEMGDKIGKGGFGEVSLATRRRTGQRVAVKKVRAGNGASAADVRAEADVMRLLDHPHGERNGRLAVRVWSAWVAAAVCCCACCAT
jgi:hypothetical protein